MSTDVVGFGALMLASEEASLEVRRRMRAVLRPIIERHGHWYEETGDGTLSWFESALDAVRCALAIQQAVHGDPDLTIKIGIDLGDVLFDEDRLHGLTVASAISIGDRTEPGGLCVSESAFNQLHGRIDVEVDDLGPVQLRVFPRPIRLYRIRTGNEVEVEAGDPPSERRLAAILHADVVSYSHMMATQEDWTVRAITEYLAAADGHVREHRGRIVDTAGDGILAEFRSTLDAARCALAIQEDFAARNEDLAEERALHFRIGVHLGDVRHEAGRSYGSGLIIAQRLEALAPAGGLCISSPVYDQVRHHLDMTFESIGAQRLKNIPDPVHAYVARLGGPPVRVAGGAPAGVWWAAGLVAAAVAAGLAIWLAN